MTSSSRVNTFVCVYNVCSHCSYMLCMCKQTDATHVYTHEYSCGHVRATSLYAIVRDHISCTHVAVCV